MGPPHEVTPLLWFFLTTSHSPAPEAIVFFVKEILWEQLFSLHSIERVISEGLTFVEFKDTSVNEFSHWSITASLGMSPRKSKELRDFNIIKKITQYQKSDEIDKALQAHGFQEIDFDLFDFRSSPHS